MEDRHITIDDLQLTTSLCHATIHAIIHRLEDEEDLCTLSSKGSHAQTTGEKGAELAGAARSSRQGPRDILKGPTSSRGLKTRHYTSTFRIHYDDGGDGGDHNEDLWPCILESVSFW
jgi:2-methylcitrate dehydratase PrpD